MIIPHFHRRCILSLLRPTSTLRHITTLPKLPPPSTPHLITNHNANLRTFSTRQQPNNNNRPPKETVLLPGVDFEHWLVVFDDPDIRDNNLTRDDLISGYIKTLAHILGSEEEAKRKIYSVSTRHYYAFGALLSEEIAYKLKDLPHVRWVLPDSYIDVMNKTYAGEPFIDGQAVPYDPKYHELWVHNHEQSQRNNFKNKRRQRDPSNSRLKSRSPPVKSKPRSSSQNEVPASGPPSQPPPMSNMQSQKPGYSPSPNSDVAALQYQTSQVQNNIPPTFHSHTPQRPPMQDRTSPLNPPPFETVTTSQGNQNKMPAAGFQNQSGHSSQIQKQTPSSSHTTSWDGPRQFQDPASGYQSPPLPPPPRDSNSQNWGYQRQDMAHVTGFKNQFAQSSQTLNKSSASSPYPYTSPRDGQNYNWEPSSVPQSQLDNWSPTTPATNMPLHAHSSAVQREGSTSQAHPNFPTYGDTRSHDQNNVAHNYYPLHSPGHQQNQNTSRANVGNYQNAEQGPHFHRGNMQAQVQPNGVFYRDKSNSMQNEASHEGSHAQSLQHQHDSYAHSNMQSSDVVASNQGRWSYQNANWTPAPPNVVPSYKQERDLGSRNAPFQVLQNSCTSRNATCNLQDGSSHYSNPTLTAEHQHYLSASRDQPNSISNAVPQGWNQQNLKHPVQNNFNSTGVTSPVQTPQHQMPRSMHNDDFQSNVRHTPQQGNYHGGTTCGHTGTEVVEPRGFQERDTPNY